jgi:L-seryl-tRNA(Ser) seleniumtransferase
VDPETGERKHREARLLPDLCALTGAESGTVVNNNAGALLLALAALAGGREVLVSRGELIEIGGGFRLPDLMQLSGARLVEVGTTNRTYARDYEAAVTADTALLLRVHTSNYRVVGFQHGPAREELVAIARRRALPLLEDLGSGLPGPPPPSSGALCEEPDVRSSLAAGVDLVCFSGDKLMGGPQAGVLAGRAELVARCRSHQLFRALRPDRLALAALAATLATWRRDPGLVPVAALLALTPPARSERARVLAARLGAAFPHARFEAVDSEAQAGSGSLPARALRSAAVEVRWPGLPTEELARRLRTGQPPVFAQLRRDRVRLDVLALLPGDDERLQEALAALPAATAEGGDGALHGGDGVPHGGAAARPDGAPRP